LINDKILVKDDSSDVCNNNNPFDSICHQGFMFKHDDPRQMDKL